MAASLSITPSSYNGTYTYVGDGESAVEVTGSFCVDSAKIVSLYGEISNVGTFTGGYDTDAVVYKLEPEALTDADDLAAAAAEVEAAITEAFWPTPEEEVVDDGAEGGTDGEGGNDAEGGGDS